MFNPKVMMALPDTQLDLQNRLVALKSEHRGLDAAITSHEELSPWDQVTLRRLKKQKLRLKDEIGAILEQLHPDILA